MKKLIGNILLWIGALIVFNIITIVAFFINIFRYAFKKELADYFLNLAIGEDQKAGSYLYGTEDFTISAYSYYLGVIRDKKVIFYFMKFIDFFPKLAGNPDHCKNAFFSEKRKAKKNMNR